MARKQQLTEEQLNVLTQRVLQLRHDVVSTRQLLEHLRDDNEAAGDSIIALNELFEKSEHFSIWLAQIAEDLQITTVPTSAIDTSSTLVKDIQTVEVQISRLVTNAMEVERELLSASSSQGGAAPLDGVEGEDEFEDAQEFEDAIQGEEDGTTNVIVEEEKSPAEEVELGERPESPEPLCHDDERAAQLFQELLQPAGIGPHNWSECPEPQGNDAFQVRGKTYLSDNRKIPSDTTPFVCVGVQIVSFSQRRDNMAQTLTSCPLHNLPVSLQDRTFILLNWQIPGTPVIQVMCYFMLKKEHEHHSPRKAVKEANLQEWLLLLHKFWNGDDEFRDARYKLIPRIVDGPWIIRKSVGTKPALIGKKLKQRYFQGPNYLEVDIDLGSSMVAARILSVVRDYCSSITVDMAVTIQGEEAEELPERVMCGVRFSGVHFTAAIPSEEYLSA